MDLTSTIISSEQKIFTRCLTGKSLSEALIFKSTNPQYDDRLFIELQVQCMKIPSSNLGRTCCEQKLFLTFRTIFVQTCSPHVLQKDKDLPVVTVYKNILKPFLMQDSLMRGVP